MAALSAHLARTLAAAGRSAGADADAGAGAGSDAGWLSEDGSEWGSPGGALALGGAGPGADLWTDLVGVGCLYPGASPTGAATASSGPGGFWGPAAAGASLQRAVPFARWDLDGLYSSGAALGRSYARFAAFAEVSEAAGGGFLKERRCAGAQELPGMRSSAGAQAVAAAASADPPPRRAAIPHPPCQGVELFDAPFFRLSRAEATALDPQARLLLQVAQEAFVDAGAWAGQGRGQQWDKRLAARCSGCCCICLGCQAAAERGTCVVAPATRIRRPCAGEAYAAADLAPATGTYVGCMFTDYMSLLRVALGQKHSGPVMTGARPGRGGPWRGRPRVSG